MKEVECELEFEPEQIPNNEYLIMNEEIYSSSCLCSSSKEVSILTTKIYSNSNYKSSFLKSYEDLGDNSPKGTSKTLMAPVFPF